ncbi:hypothetical protein OIV83_001852 [Microbotryomycetes sp. JL201]|nr:hypothetical protein OIV83_001852 [Microbotryomycetes sp. JL201]
MRYTLLCLLLAGSRAQALVRTFSVSNSLVWAEPKPAWSTSTTKPDSVVLSTTSEGAKLAFAFRGQSIEIAGLSDGPFDVLVDEERAYEFEGSGSKALMFRVVGLALDTVHTVTITKGRGKTELKVESLKIITASGSDVRPALVPLDGRQTFCTSSPNSQTTSLQSSTWRPRSDSVLRTAPWGFSTSVKSVASVSSASTTSYARGTFVNSAPLPTINPLDLSPTDHDIENGSDEAVKAAGAIVGTLVGLALIVIGICSYRRHRRDRKSFAHELYIPPKKSTNGGQETRSLKNLWFVNSSVDTTKSEPPADRLPDTRRFYKLSSDNEAPPSTSRDPTPVLQTSRPSPAPFSSFQFPRQHQNPQPRLPSELVAQQEFQSRHKVTRFASKPPSLIFATTPRTTSSTTRSSLPSISEILSPVETPTFGGPAASDSTVDFADHKEQSTNVNANVNEPSMKVTERFKEEDQVRTNFFQADYIGQRIHGPKYSLDQGDPRMTKQSRARQTM